ncbi:hypothetical protein ACKKBG_A36360 [Auxenochlorella protothecoides x Auxenochlorella symbiontica]
MVALTTVAGSVAAAAGALLVAWPIAIWWEVRKLEKPKYVVTRTLKTRQTPFFGTTAEIRSYAPFLTAEVTLEGCDMNKAMGSGFRQVAGFIFGKNKAVDREGAEKVSMTSPVAMEVVHNEKIGMTAPVMSQQDGGGVYKVAFTMPSKYTKDTLPRPDNPNVKIIEVPSRTMAVLTWNGGVPREETTASKTQELRALLAAAGVKSTGSVHVWGYHPPWALPIQRINEILLEVESK